MDGVEVFISGKYTTSDWIPLVGQAAPSGRHARARNLPGDDLVDGNVVRL